MDDKELQKKKQAEIEIIQKIGLAALEKSNQQRIEVEKKAAASYQRMEAILKELQQVVDTWDRNHVNPTTEKPKLHLVPPLEKETAPDQNNKEES